MVTNKMKLPLFIYPSMSSPSASCSQAEQYWRLAHTASVSPFSRGSCPAELRVAWVPSCSASLGGWALLWSRSVALDTCLCGLGLSLPIHRRLWGSLAVIASLPSYSLPCLCTLSNSRLAAEKGTNTLNSSS